MFLPLLVCTIIACKSRYQFQGPLSVFSETVMLSPMEGVSLLNKQLHFSLAGSWILSPCGEAKNPHQPWVHHRVCLQVLGCDHSAPATQQQHSMVPKAGSRQDRAAPGGRGGYQLEGIEISWLMITRKMAEGNLSLPLISNQVEMFWSKESKQTHITGVGASM